MNCVYVRANCKSFIQLYLALLLEAHTDREIDKYYSSICSIFPVKHAPLRNKGRYTSPFSDGDKIQLILHMLDYAQQPTKLNMALFLRKSF